MLLELELPRVLAPDLSSNCYSRACLQQTHLNCSSKRQTFIFLLTPSCVAQGERCAPAAFLRSMSNLSGPLSRIEPLSSVPVVTTACTLHWCLVDRSEAHSKCRSNGKLTNENTDRFWRGPSVRLFLVKPRLDHTPIYLPLPVDKWLTFSY